MIGPTSQTWDDARRLTARILAFGLISGVGLAIDYGVFLLLINAGIHAGWANAVSAGLAISFVFFVSIRRIFAYDGKFLFGRFVAYILFQAAAVGIASLAITLLVNSAGLVPVLAKAATLPVTFTANFLFMNWLARVKLS